MPINTNFGVSGNMGITRSAGVGVRGPGAAIMSPIESTNQMMHQRMVESVRFLHDSEVRATNLRNTINNLPTAFAPRTAVSGNTDALRINTFTGQNLSNMEVTIYQLAAHQRNEGIGLERNANFAEYGKFEFEIEIDGETRTLSFEVTASEVLTNQQFQQRMATTINNANIGITASVTSAGNFSALNIVTRTTGAGEDDAPRFTITDVTGNAVEFTGIDNIAQEGQNALFYVNDGEQQSSTSNDVNLGNGLNVTLLQTSEEPIAITLGQDRLHMQNAARNLVNQFNALLDAAHSNSADRNTRALARQIEGAARMSRRALADIGITVGQDGFLSIDATRMNAAAENGSLERFLTGGESGQPNSFINRLSRTTDSIIRNPARHISNHATRLPGFNAALATVRSGNNPAPAQQQAPSPHDAYFNNNDWMSVLFDTSR